MADLVKFNKSKTYSDALTLSTTNTGTLYFPTNKNAILLNGNIVGEKNIINAGSNTTVGGTATPIYLKDNVLTPLTASVGGTGTKITYLASGVFSESTQTVGSGTNPVYLSSGTITKSTSTVGSSLTPMYLNNGVLTAFTGSVGNGNDSTKLQAVYLNAGKITAFSTGIGDLTTPIFIDAAGRFATCSGYGDAAYCSVDSEISNKSSVNLPTTKAVTDYVAANLRASQAVKFTGTFNAQTGVITSVVSEWDGNANLDVGMTLIPGTDTTKTYVNWSALGESVYRGMFFTVDVAGNFNNEALEVGDSILIVKQGTSASSMPSYITIQTNLVTATADKAGTVTVSSTALASAGTSMVYNVTGANAKIATEVTAAINALDVTAVTFDADETIKSISETNGKITVTKQDIQTATSSQYGFAKLYSDTTQTVAANAVTSTASRTYGVQKNSSGQLVVNVPWVDTNSTPLATASVRGGIKIGFTGTDDTTNSKRTVGVELSSEKAYVSIPYATTSSSGLMSAVDKTNLNDVVSALTWQ